jgi:fatty acid elongase 3
MSLDLKSIPIPTLDRPFGIELWPIFSKCYSTLFGYAPENFEFVSGTTVMSTFTQTTIALTAYYIIIFGGRELMRKREPFMLNGPFMVHNLYLTIISGGLLALFIEQLLSEVIRNGVFHAICSYEGGWTDKLVILYYVSLPTSCDRKYTYLSR